MRHRARVYPALVNNLFLLGGALLVILPLVLAYLVFLQHRTLGRSDWWILLWVFGGATLLGTPLMTLSELGNWFEVDAAGLTCRTTIGRVFVRKTYEVPWADISGVRLSKYMPYRRITLTIQRQGGDRTVHEHISVPLYVNLLDELTRAILTYAPEEHPIRRFFTSRGRPC